MSNEVNGVDISYCPHVVSLGNKIRCALMKGNACKDKWLCINNPFCSYKKIRRKEK